MTSRIKTLALGLCLSGLAGAAAADPVRWTLDPQPMADGTMVVGEFTFDADTGLYSGVQVSVQAGSSFSASNYSAIRPDPASTAMRLILEDVPQVRTIRITFRDALTNAGGVNRVVNITEATCAAVPVTDCGLFTAPARAGGGQAVRAPAPPEPVPTVSEWAMILLGFTLAAASVVYLERRRTV